MPISPSRCPCKEWRKHGSYPYNASPYAKAKTEAGYRFYAPYDSCVPSCSLSAFRVPYLPVSDEDALARAAALLLGLGFWRAIYRAVVDALFRPWGRHGP